jgi:hypothetical protein
MRRMSGVCTEEWAEKTRRDGEREQMEKLSRLFKALPRTAVVETGVAGLE